MSAPDRAEPAEHQPAGSPRLPRRPQRLATAVVEDLIDRVVGGEFPAGSALPTEPELCASYGVSRTVVREAIKAMEGMRMLTVQQGQGTRARDLQDWDLLNPMVLAAIVQHDAELSILDDLIDVRRALESQMTAQAAQKATDEQLAHIEEAMQTLRQVTSDPAHYLLADLDFHDRILAASGNRLGRAAIHTITDQAFRSLRYVGDPTPAECELSNVAHQEVLDRLKERDIDGSARAMDDHILSSWYRRRPSRDQVAPHRSR